MLKEALRSVIPLFKRQIANGGPVTVTDKRIIRYFIDYSRGFTACPSKVEAMAKNGELFVLDMGKLVKIMDLGNKEYDPLIRSVRE